jgi:hypothetical protein
MSRWAERHSELRDRLLRPIRRTLRIASLSQVRQLLITIGLILLGLGLAWPWLGRIGLGRLPGDISIRRPGFAFYFPLGSSSLASIVLSLALTLIFWLFRR